MTSSHWNFEKSYRDTLKEQKEQKEKKEQKEQKEVE